MGAAGAVVDCQVLAPRLTDEFTAPPFSTRCAATNDMPVADVIRPRAVAINRLPGRLTLS